VTARPDLADRSSNAPNSLTAWLRGRSDAELVALLRRRPDLALPAPVDLATLASRASVRTSISRALDGLDAFTLRVLEVISVTGPDASLDRVRAWFSREDVDSVDDAISRLQAWLLLWGDATRLHLAGAVREVLGPYPAGLGRSIDELYATVNDLTMAALLRRLELAPATQPKSGATAAAAVVDRLDSILADLSGVERSILERLAAGPPIGSVRGGDSASPVQRLIEIGLLVPIDSATVELPREISMHLRTVPAGDVRPAPEALATTERGPAVIDGGGATAVLEVVRLAEVLLHALAEDPAVQLRAGGLGVRDLRRLARLLEIEEAHTGLLLEVCFEAGLLASSSTTEPSYLPTTEFDAWLTHSTADRWVQLARAWVPMTRLPSLIGERDDRDKTIAALSVDVERHSTPALRLQLLRLLAELPPGQAPTSTDAVLEQLSWRAPRRASANRAMASTMLIEAAFLGVTGYGAITGYTRALLDGIENGAPRAETNASDALAAALPAAVDEFLLQPDLTAVVPGPPAPDLARELALSGDLESTGGASVYRLSPASLRRALDAGRTGEDLLRFFGSRSRTPVPQALEYLIKDIATTHGRLRVGTAKTYLRCDDAALLDRVLAEPGLDGLGLQRIAPTVVIGSAAVSVVLERLRAHGFSPAAESADGAVVTYAADAARVPARQHSRIARVRASAIPDAQLAEVVSRLRASERLAAAVQHSTTRVSQSIPGVTSASILELLRTAVRESRTIALGYVDDAGVPSQHTLQPISVGGGVVRGHAPDDQRLRSYPLQRVTTVSLLD